MAGWSGIPAAYADTPSQDADDQAGGGSVEGGGSATADAPALAPAAGPETAAGTGTPLGRIIRLIPRLPLVLPGIPVLGPASVTNSVTNSQQQASGGQRPAIQLPTRQRGQHVHDAEPSAAPTAEHVDVAAAPTPPPRFRRTPLSLPTHSAPSVLTSLPAISHDVVAPTISALGLTTPAVAPAPRLATPSASALGVIARVLSGFGATPGPATPAAPSPVLWTLLAFVRRDFERSFANHSPVANPTQSAPTVPGVATGTVGPTTDVDGDKLTYSLVQGKGPTKGQVVVTADGKYTYVATDPTLRANGGDDTFQVAIDDGPGNPPHIHGLPGLIHDLVAVANPALAERLYPGGGDVTITTVTVHVTAVPTGPNLPPTAVVGKPTVDGSTGVVTGTVTGTDPEHRPVTYSIDTDPTKAPQYGTVTINPTTGGYTYTPKDGVRLQAALTSQKEEDHFYVNVSDGVNTTPVLVDHVVVAELAANSVIATPTVGNGPTATAYGPGGKTYVVNTDDDTITVLQDNVPTGAPIRVGDRPVALTVAADGTVYVANADGHSVTRIDPTTSATTSYALGVDDNGDAVSPTGIAVNPAGTVVYTTNTNSTISVLKVSDGTVSSIAVDPTAIEVGSDGSLYAVDTAHDLVSIVDPHGNVSRVDVGDAPAGIAIKETAGGVPQYAYVTNSGAGTVSVIDLTTNTKLPQDITVGTNPQGIAITPDGTKVYVANYGSGSLSVINTADNSVTPVENLGANPYDIAINAAGTQATITNPTDKKVTILVLTGNDKPVAVIHVNAPDANGVVTGTVTGTDADGDALTYALGTDATKGTLNFDPADGSFTYSPFTASRDAALKTPGVDVDTFTVTIDDNHGAVTTATVPVTIAPSPSSYYVGDPIAVGHNPYGVAVTDHFTYVLNASDNTVSVIDNATGKVVGDPLAVGHTPAYAVASGDRVYVVNQADGTVSVIDADSHTLVDTDASTPGVVDPISVAPPGTILGQPVISSDGSRLYVSGSGSGVYAVNTVNNTVVPIPLSPPRSANDIYVTGSLALSEDGTRLYANTLHIDTNSGTQVLSNKIAVIDADPSSPTFNTVLDDDIVVDNDPTHHLGNLAIVGDKLYAADPNVNLSGSGPLTNGNGHVYVIDVADPGSATYGHIVGSIEAGTAPGAIRTSPDGSRLYVVNNIDGTVTVVDTTDDTVAETLTYDPGRTAFSNDSLAISPDGTVIFVTSGTDGTVTPIGYGAPAIVPSQYYVADPIAVGHNPFGVVATDHYTYVLNTADNSVSVVDNVTGQAVGSPLPVGQVPAYVTATQDRVYVVNQADGTISVIDADTHQLIDTDPSTPGVIDPIKVNAGMLAQPVVSADGSQIYVAGYTNGVYVVNTADNSVHSIVVSPDPTGTDTYLTGALALSGDGKRLYANTIDITTNKNTIAVIDTDPSSPTFDTVLDPDFVVDPDPTHHLGNIVVAGDKLYAVDVNSGTGNGTAYAIDIADPGSATYGHIIGSAPVGKLPVAVTTSPDKTRVYVANGIDGTVTVINAADGTVADTVTYDPGRTAYSSDSIAVSPDGKILFVTSGTDGTVVPIGVGAPLAYPHANQAPTIAPTKGEPANGVVTGNLHASDPDGDALSYTFTGATKGSLAIDPTDGSFTYTPSPESRDAAAASVGPDTDTFTVTVSDGHGHSTDSTVTVTVAPTGVLGSTTVPGTAEATNDALLGASDGPVISPDGSRAIQIVSSSDGSTRQAVLINTATGAQVGAPIALPTSTNPPTVAYNATGSRAVFVVQSPDPVTSVPTSSVILVDTATGQQVGSTYVNSASVIPVKAQFNPDGDRLVLSDIEVPGGNFAAAETHVVVLDAATGSQIGTTAVISGATVDGVTFSPNDSRGYMTVVFFGSQTTRVAVLDTDTGTQVGDFAVGQGIAAGGNAVLSADGTRLYQVTNIGNGTTTRLTILDAATGQIIGTPTDVAGSSTGKLVLSADGTRGVLTSIDQSVDPHTTTVVVVDPATGAAVGSPSTLSGSSLGSPVVSPDGSRFVVTTINGGAGQTSTVAIYDATTGQQVGAAPFTADTNLLGAPTFSPDGTRLLVVGSGSSSAFLLDSATGEALGPPIAYANPVGNPTFTANGRALLTSSSAGSTTVTAINLVDGTTVGSATFDGAAVEGTTGAPSGERVLQTVTVFDQASSTNVTKLVVLDIANSPTVVGELNLDGSGAGGVTLTRDRTRAVFTGTVMGSDPTTTVTVIDTAAYIDNPNTAPVVTAPPTVNVPSGPAGVVTGRVHASDLDGDTLAYTVSGAAKGTVSVDPATGRFTFTPYASARSAAAASVGPDTDFFTVSIDDGRGGHEVSVVTVDIAPTGVLGSTTVPGSPAQINDPVRGEFENLAVSPDGGRAIQIVSSDPDGDGVQSRQAIVIDTATGHQVGQAISLADGQNSTQVTYNASGSRAVVLTSEQDGTGQYTTYATVVDTARGTQVGSPVEVGGYGDEVQFSPDGSKVVVVTDDFDPSGAGQRYTTHVVAIDSSTGAQVTAAPLDLTGYPADLVFSPNGTRAYVTVGSATADTSQVVVIDPATGQQIGNAINLVGADASGGVVFDPNDETRLFQTTFTYNGDDATGRVSIIDAGTGQVIGTPIELPGTPNKVVLAANGTRAIVTSVDQDTTGPTPTYTTRVVVIDTATGGVVGDSTNEGFGTQVNVSPDGDRFVVVTTSGFGGDRKISIPIYDANTGAQVGDQAYVFDGGDLYYAPSFSSDGSRLILTGASDIDGTGTLRTPIRILDTNTGESVGGPIAVSGDVAQPVFFTADGRALFTSSTAGTTTVTAIDLTDGSDAGSTTLDGQAVGSLMGAAGGQRVLQTVSMYDAPSGGFVTRLVAIDVQAEPTVVDGLYLDGYPAGAVTLTPDRTRALLTSSSLGSDAATTVTVIDPAAFIDNPNAAPVASPSVGTPDPSTAAVTVALHASDPDHDALTYMVTSLPTQGSLTVDRDGRYTYTPTPAARSGAASTAGADSDSFTVSLTDDHGNVTDVAVSVPITPAGVVGQVSAAGGQGATTLSPSGATSYVSATSYADGAYTTNVAIVDNATGAKLGTVSLPGIASDPVQFSADGTRAFVLTQDGASNPVAFAVFDTATGEQVGETLTVAGSPTATVKLSADKSSAVGVSYDSTTGNTQVTVIDTQTGTVTTQSVTGTPATVVFSGNDSRFAVTTTEGANSNVAVFDRTTGEQLGAPLSVTGSLQQQPAFSDDGTRLALVHGTSTSKFVTIVDATTGAQLGTSLHTVNGLPAMSNGTTVASFADGDSRIVALTTVNRGSSAGTTSTLDVVSLDAATGDQIGTTQHFSASSTSAELVGDGTLVAVRSTTTPPPRSGGTSSTQLAFVDTATGTRVGTTLNGTAVTTQAAGDDRLLATVRTATGTDVVVIDTASGNQVGTTATFAGAQAASSYANSDRSVVIATAQRSTASGLVTDTRVIYTDTGEVVSLATLPGGQGIATFGDGDRAGVTTNVYDAATDSYTTTVTLLDTTDGSQVGTTYTSAGQASSAATVFGDGRLIVTTSGHDNATNTDVAHVAVFDASDGSQLGQTLEYPGTTGGTVLAVNGHRAIVGIANYDAATSTGSMRYVVIDTVSGGVLSDDATASGYATDGATFSPGGTRVAVVSKDFDQALGRYVSWVTVINVDDGTQVGQTVAFDSQSTSVRFTPDGRRLVVSTQNYDGTQTNTGTTIIQVADAAGAGGNGGNGGLFGNGGVGGNGGAGGAGVV